MPVGKSEPRVYDNSWRAKSAAENRRVILDCLVELLVERKGGQFTFKEISERTGMAERSIYRFYNDKESLHLELDIYLQSYIASSVEKLGKMGVSKFAKNAFLLFDRYEGLVLAYVYSPFGRTARLQFRQKLNRLISEKLAQEKPGRDDLQRQKRIAFICTLINAKIWADIREDFGFSGNEMAETVEWAIGSLVKEL